MVNYGTLVKGGEDEVEIVLTDPEGWPDGSDAWTWEILLGEYFDRTTQVAALTSSSAAITTVTNANDTMTLIFPISHTLSDTLSPGKYAVELKGEESDDTTHYYNVVNGIITVRAPDGAV